MDSFAHRERSRVLQSDPIGAAIRPARRFQLSTQTFTEVDAKAGLLVVPVGATEQHGPHLPLATDTQLAVALCDRLAARAAGVTVAPPLAYGSSGEHQAFAGTISIGQHATELVLVELGRSAIETFSQVLYVSTHGGNAEPVSRAVELLRDEGRDVRAWSPAALWSADAHAGRVETSLLLALDQGQVRMDVAARGNITPLPHLIDALRRHGVAAVADNGVLGDPFEASAHEGNALLALAVDALASAVANWSEGPDRAWL